MACHGGPNLVEDNLVFFLDAGNTKSYPGTGDTWTDMMGTNNGTLTDGPTFSSDNGGSIVFDGDNDDVELGSIDSSNVLSLNDPAGGGLTISFAINWTQAGDNYPRIFNRSSGGNGANGWSLYVNRTSNNVGKIRMKVNNSYNITSTSNVTPATWEIWTLTHVNATDGEWVCYKNGISNASGTQTYSIPDTTTTAQIGSWHGVDREFKGQIPFVMVYDRALSAVEVKQNFDALKVRYGL